MEELRIGTPDDSGNYNITLLDIIKDEELSKVRYNDRRRYSNNDYLYSPSNMIYPSKYRNHNEPTIAAINQYLKERLNLNRKGISDFNCYIKVGNADNPFTMLFSKIGTRYHLMGEMQSKDTILTSISRVIYRSCFDEDKNKLYSYMIYHLRLPANVSYALENRAPFHWYIKAKKIEVRFNVKMIDDDECAMEISDGIWAPISVKNLNVYLNYYWRGQDRGSWKYLSPKRLWTKLMKKQPTKVQEKMMIAFLGQNRTDDIVQDRAVQLVKDLEERYTGRIKVLWSSPGKTNKPKIQAMCVRGKLADWIITDAQYKSEIQSVSTYLYNKGRLNTSSNSSGIKFMNGLLAGPICIDNMSKNSSVGDQFAARAMALLNDTITVNIVNTIKRYLNDGHYEGQSEQRFEFEDVTHENIQAIIKKQRA